MNSSSSLVVQSNAVQRISQCNSVLSSTVINSFCEYLDVSAVTLKAYRAGIRQFIAFTQLNGDIVPNRKTVLSFKQCMLSNGHKASTVSLYLSALRRFFDWCESEGLYANVARGVKSPKQAGGHKRDALSGSQLRECLQSMSRESEQQKRDYAMFLLMATCGLRTVEVSRADAGDIQLLQGTACLFVQGKGRSGKDEFVQLPEPALSAIREYLSERGQVRDDEPLFTSCSRRNKGGRLSTRTISRAAKNAMKSAGYDSPRLTAHSLRHSAATLALQGGLSLEEVKEFMRHSSINITLVYVHTVNRLKSGCENAVTQAIFTA